MALKTQEINCLGIFSGILVLTATVFGSMLFAEAKIDENACKTMYERYKQWGEEKFREKYKNKSILNECIKLYKNPNWYFVGKSKIDKNYEKLGKLLQDSSTERKIDVKVLSSVPIGKEKFLVKFKACMDKSAILQPSFLIKSQLEQYLVMSSKTLQTGKCNDYNVPVKAKQTSNIQIEYVSDLSKYPNLKSRTI